MTAASLHPTALLLRGFAVDFLTAHDLTAPTRVMAPDYRLTIGGHVLDGRDAKYVPATVAQLERFPGLGVTVHDIVIGENTAALRLSEHGASLRDEKRIAVWQIIALFRTDGRQLKSCWAEEDYLGRRRQLATGVPDPVEPPCPAPWDAQPVAADPANEKVARRWLARGVLISDLPRGAAPAATAPFPEDLIRVDETHVDELVCAGDRVAFHLEHRGTYAGGFEDIDASLVNEPAVLRVAGLLTVRDGGVVAARVVTDRLGLHSALRARR